MRDPGEKGTFVYAGRAASNAQLRTLLLCATKRLDEEATGMITMDSLSSLGSAAAATATGTWLATGKVVSAC